MGTMVIPNPPERLPSMQGGPEEVMAFEEIRRAMPNAYLKDGVRTPPDGVSAAKGRGKGESARPPSKSQPSKARERD